MPRPVSPVATLAAAISLTIAAGVPLAQAASDRGHRPVHHHRHGHHHGHHHGLRTESFNRIAFFPSFLNAPVSDDEKIDTPSVSEIVAASEDGMTLVYTDSELELIGFVDITRPAAPSALGAVDVGGEPTSVAVAGDYALVGVNTSPDFVSPSGELLVVHIPTQTIVHGIDVGGQPDSVAVSPDRRYAAVVIENERDEDLGDGEPPQAPGGGFVIVDLVGAPAGWTTRTVDLTGLADLYPGDPEPEYVDINEKNVAVVTLQENNHIVLVNLRNGKVKQHFSAGTVDLDQVDATEEDPAFISLTESLVDVPREPDGVAWIANNLFVTADEGDLFGGSRGFTMFNKKGKVKYAAGNSLEHLTVRLGHYPDARSENKGNEPENVEFGRFGNTDYLFVASERSSLVFVYELDGKTPVYKQTLPAGVAPEGVLAIPSRGLLIAASEEPGAEIDDDELAIDIFRAGLNIYRLERGEPDYPTVVSEDRADGTPIPWGALSGLAADPYRPHIVWSVPDSFYQRSRIFRMDVSQQPAVIEREIVIKDRFGVLAARDAGLVNDDGTVNLDLEGIDVGPLGGFWLASEGDDSPALPNLVLHVSPRGDILQAITLPAATRARIRNNGYEGIALAGRYVFVAFQREWGVADGGANGADPAGFVRIGRYDLLRRRWGFYHYPLDTVESHNGGWVGLSELTHLGGGEFAVIERDNQGGPSAAVKRVYRFSVAGIPPGREAPVGVTPSFPVVAKTLVRDLMPDLADTGGLVLEKIEGLTVLPDGTGLVVSDNDGVDGSNGETQLLRIRNLLGRRWR